MWNISFKNKQKKLVIFPELITLNKHFLWILSVYTVQQGNCWRQYTKDRREIGQRAVVMLKARLGAAWTEWPAAAHYWRRRCRRAWQCPPCCWSPAGGWGRAAGCGHARAHVQVGRNPTVRPLDPEISKILWLPFKDKNLTKDILLHDPYPNIWQLLMYLNVMESNFDWINA